MLLKSSTLFQLLETVRYDRMVLLKRWSARPLPWIGFIYSRIGGTFRASFRSLEVTCRCGLKQILPIVSLLPLSIVWRFSETSQCILRSTKNDVCWRVSSCRGHGWADKLILVGWRKLCETIVSYDRAIRRHAYLALPATGYNPSACHISTSP